jgi:hypothetical protein
MSAKGILHQLAVNRKQAPHWVGFNCFRCETFVLTTNQDWACLCQRCYHTSTEDMESLRRETQK